MIPLPDLTDAHALARVLMEATPPARRRAWRTASTRVASCGENWAPHVHLASGQVRHFLRLCESPECPRCGPMAVTETLVQLITETSPLREFNVYVPGLRHQSQRSFATIWVGHRRHAGTRAVADRVEHLRKRLRRPIYYLEIRPDEGGSVENAVRGTISEVPIPQSPRTPLWVLSDADLSDGTDQDDHDAWHGGWVPRMAALRIAAAVMLRAASGYAVSSNMVPAGLSGRRRWITKHRRTPKGGFSKALYQGGATRHVLAATERRLAAEFGTPKGFVPDGKMDEYANRYPDIVKEEKTRERSKAKARKGNT